MLKFTEHEAEVVKKILPELKDCYHVKTILGINLAPNNHPDLNLYRQNFILSSMILPAAYWFFSNKNEWPISEETEKELVSWLKFWLNKEEYHWNFVSGIKSNSSEKIIIEGFDTSKPKKKKKK